MLHLTKGIQKALPTGISFDGFRVNFFAPPWNANSSLSAACVEVEFFEGLFPDRSFSFLT